MSILSCERRALFFCQQPGDESDTSIGKKLLGLCKGMGDGLGDLTKLTIKGYEIIFADLLVQPLHQVIVLCRLRIAN